MWKIVSILSFLLSILSLLMLIKVGLMISYIAPLQAMLEWYEAALQFGLGWLEPTLGKALAVVQAWVPFRLQLFSHWKHALVLMWLYVAGDFIQYWVRGRTVSGLSVLLVGVVIALVASVASAVVELNNPSMLPVVWPVLGFVIFEAIKAPMSATFYRRAGDTWWETCRFYLVNFALTNALIGAAIMASALLARPYQIPVPNLVILMGFVTAIALRNVVIGAQVARLFAHEGGTWASRYNKSATGRLGVHILRALAAVLIVVAFNAGLRFAGLP